MNNTSAPQSQPATEIFQAPLPQNAAPTPSVPPAQGPPIAPIGEMPLPPQTPIPPSPPGMDKKKLLFIGVGILLVVLVLFFVVRMIMSSSRPKDEGKAELTYWGVYEDPRVMQVLINDFQRENPNIKVTFVQQDPQQYRDRLMTRIRNGNGPDIFRYHNTWVPMLRGVLLPLTTDAVTPQDYEKSYYKVIRSDLIQNGGILGIPLGIDTLALFVNDQLFASQQLTVPDNWDDFALRAAALTSRDDDANGSGAITTAGAAVGTYDNVTHAPDIISLLMVQIGVDLYNISQKEDLAAQSLDFYNIFAKGDNNIKKVWDGAFDPSVVSFANGRVGMYFGYSWDIFTIRAINPSLAFSIHPVPNLPGQKRDIASYWVEGVSNQTKFPQASMKFMKYLNKKETQQKFYAENAKIRGLGGPYARVDLAQSLKNEPLLYPFVQQAPYAVSTPFVGDTQDNGLNATLNGYLKNAVLEVSGNTSAQTAVQTLSQGVTQAYQQYGQ